MNPLFTLGEEFRFHHSSRFRKKAKMRKMLFWHFWVFSFSRADKAFEIFGVFEVFRLLCNLQYELLFWNFWGFLRILVRLCSQVPAKVQSALLLVACVTTLGGRRGGAQKQTTHQKTKTKLSSATPNRDKTIHCQRKRRKKHPASNVAAESAPHPRHAAKACDNNTQTIPNNMVLWQRWATCRQGWRPSISNRVPRDPAILLDLSKDCGLLKPRQFLQKGLQQSHFRGRKHISFLDSKKWSSPVALKACCSNKTQLWSTCVMRRASCLEQLGSTLPKMGLPRATAFRFGQGHPEAVFNL